MIKQNPYEERLELYIKNADIQYELKGYSYIINKIQDALERCEKMGKWAIWGAGNHTYELLKKIKIGDNTNLMIIDNNNQLWGTLMDGIEIVSPQIIEEKEIKAIFFSVCKAREEIKKQIYGMNKNITIIDVYEDEYKTNGMPTPFYYWTKYLSLHQLRYEYIQESDKERKETLLQKVIAGYLEIRDLKNAMVSMQEYIKNYDKKKRQYELLEQEIQLLLEAISKQLMNKQTEDVLLLLYDALGARHVYDNLAMPYLNQLKEEGTYYTHAYTPGIYTKESVEAIYTQRSLFDKLKALRVTNKLEEENPLFEYAKTKNYSTKVYYAGEKEWYEKFYTVFTEKEQDKLKRETLTELLWAGVIDLAIDNKNHLKIFHFLNETHLPYIGGKHNLRSDKFYFNDYSEIKVKKDLLIERYWEALRYADEQTEFYLNMLGNNVVKIIFADHSTAIQDSVLDVTKGYESKWKLLFYHVPLIIHGRNIPVNRENRTLSLIHLVDIVKGIMDNGQIPHIKDEFAKVEFQGYYNKEMRKLAKNYGLEDVVDGFEVVLDSEYKLVRDSKKELRYYVLDNEEEIEDIALKNVIYNKLYQYLQEE